MDSKRRRFLALALAGAALWTLGRVATAENAPAPSAAELVHLTLNVEGMH
ncbi:MAG: hypothetical protein ABSA52_09780 [Candidatus Binatia bacterium]|jgi:hypothetical protein